MLSTNYKQLKVTLYHVDPSDWHAYQRFQNSWNDNKTPAPPPGHEIKSEEDTVSAAGAPEAVETQIDLALPLHEGLLRRRRRRARRLCPAHRRTLVMAWVEVTHSGLDAVSDADHLVVWANSLLMASRCRAYPSAWTTDGPPPAGPTVRHHGTGLEHRPPGRLPGSMSPSCRTTPGRHRPVGTGPMACVRRSADVSTG